jgi:hypothetical protein
MLAMANRLFTGTTSLLDSRDGPFDQSSVRGFVSWFFRNDMSLVGYYKQNQDDSPAVIDLSQYSYGVGITARF